MQTALIAHHTPSSSPHRLHFPFNVVKFSPLQRPSCALGLKSSKWERRRQLTSSSSNCRPRIVCLFDGIGKLFGEDAKDAARKVFDKALEGKERTFNKWKEVSRKRETDMGGDDDNGLGGGGRYRGGGGSGNPGDEDDRIDTFLASFIFLLMYMKMRGTRWTRDYVPYTDFDAISLWTRCFLEWFLNSPFVLFLEINFLWAKLALRRLTARSREVASSTSTD